MCSCYWCCRTTALLHLLYSTVVCILLLLLRYWFFSVTSAPPLPTVVYVLLLQPSYCSSSVTFALQLCYCYCRAPALLQLAFLHSCLLATTAAELLFLFIYFYSCIRAIPIPRSCSSSVTCLRATATVELLLYYSNFAIRVYTCQYYSRSTIHLQSQHFNGGLLLFYCLQLFTCFFYCRSIAFLQ